MRSTFHICPTLSAIYLKYPTWIGLFLLVVAPCTLAQEPDIEQPFIDVLDVRVLEVEVIVTDSAGDPVAHLDRSRFRLLIDGKEVDIDFFEERREDTEVVDEVDVGTSLLIFFDDYFTDRRYRSALLKRLIDDIDALKTGDRMAIVRFAGRKLEVISDWSSSPSALRGDLESLRRRATSPNPLRSRCKPKQRFFSALRARR